MVDDVSGPARQPRFPLAPLMRMARVETHNELGAIVRLDRKRIVRYAGTGIPLLVADEMACRVGVHPSAVWPTWFEIEVPA